MQIKSYILSLMYIATNATILVPFGFYEIPQGYKGTQTTFGKLKDTVQSPGLNWRNPVTTYDLYDTRWQTDKILNVECGSAMGGTAHLTIEVINKLHSSLECIQSMARNHGVNYDKTLIYDYIPSEVVQFCKKYTLEEIYVTQFDKLDEVLGLALENNIKAYGMDKCLHIKKDKNGITTGVRINRPKLSSNMKSKFEAIEEEQKNKDLAKQRLDTDKVKQQQATQKAVMEEERKLLVAKKTSEKLKIEEESRATLQKIKDSTLKAQLISNAEGEAGAIIKIAEAEAQKKFQMAKADKQWLTPERLELEKALAFSSNSKLVFTKGLPDNAFVNIGSDLNLDVRKKKMCDSKIKKNL